MKRLFEESSELCRTITVAAVILAFVSTAFHFRVTWPGGFIWGILLGNCVLLSVGGMGIAGMYLGRRFQLNMVLALLCMMLIPMLVFAFCLFSDLGMPAAALGPYMLIPLILNLLFMRPANHKPLLWICGLWDPEYEPYYLDSKKR